MKRFTPYLLIAIMGFLASCSFFNGNGDSEIVARVGENYLYWEDVNEAIDLRNAEDSVQLLESYVDNWVKEQLLLQKALQNLSANQTNFEEQLQSYRNSLIIYAYENLLVEQKLDTHVSHSAVVAYYKDNLSNFDLREALYKARFIQLINTAPQQDSLKYWFFSRLTDFDEELAEYCTQFATNCQLDTATWIPISQFNAIFPSKSASELIEDLSLGDNEIADSSLTLLVDVRKTIKSGETAPVAYVKEQIKSIIRNKRRLKLIANAKQEIYEEATLKKKYEVYH